MKRPSYIRKDGKRVGKGLPKAQKGKVQPYQSKSLDDYNYRKQMYNDSLALHNFSQYQFQNELENKPVSDQIVDIGFGFLPVHRGERDYSKRVFNYAKNLAKNNPRIKIGLPTVRPGVTEEDYKREGSTDVYHDIIKPASIWIGDAVNAFYKKPIQEILPPVPAEIKKDTQTANKKSSTNKLNKKVVKELREPIYVEDPNDPRLRAYNDSLKLFNLNPTFAESFFKVLKAEEKAKKSGVTQHASGVLIGSSGPAIDEYRREVDRHGELLSKYGVNGFNYTSKIFPSEKNPNYKDPSSFSSNFTKDNVLEMLYKKPVQPVKYKKKEKQQRTKEYADPIEYQKALQAYTDSTSLYNSTNRLVNQINKVNQDYAAGKINKNTLRSELDKIGQLQATNRKVRNTNPLYDPNGQLIGYSPVSNLPRRSDYIQPIHQTTLNTPGQYFPTQPWAIYDYKKPVVKPVLGKKKEEPIKGNVEKIKQDTIKQSKQDSNTGWLKKYKQDFERFDADPNFETYIDYSSPWLGPQYFVKEKKKLGGWLDKLPKAQTGLNEPIFVEDPNDPRLRAYNDSLATYNLSRKIEKIFNENPADPRLEDYNRQAAALSRRTGIKPVTIRGSLGWSQPFRENLGPIEDMYMAKYKKPIQPVKYKKPLTDEQRSTAPSNNEVIYTDKNAYQRAHQAELDSANADRYRSLYRDTYIKLLNAKSQKEADQISEEFNKKSEKIPNTEGVSNILRATSNAIISDPAIGGRTIKWKHNLAGLPKKAKSIRPKVHAVYTESFLPRTLKEFIQEKPTAEPIEKITREKYIQQQPEKNPNAGWLKKYKSDYDRFQADPNFETYIDYSSPWLGPQYYVREKKKFGGSLRKAQVGTEQQPFELDEVTVSPRPIYPTQFLSPKVREVMANQKPQPQLGRSRKTEEQAKAEEARGRYIENPTLMDYVGQAGYIPYAFLHDPFSMGETLKEARRISSDPNLDAYGRVTKGLDEIINPTLPQTFTNLAIGEGIGGLASGVIKRAIPAPQMMSNLFRNLPKGYPAGIGPDFIPRNPNPALGEPIGTMGDIKKSYLLNKYGLKTDVPTDLYQTQLDKDLIDYNRRYGTNFNIRNLGPTKADKLSGYSDIPQFNEQLKQIKATMQFGKRPLLSRADFVGSREEQLADRLLIEDSKNWDIDFSSGKPELISRTGDGVKDIMERAAEQGLDPDDILKRVLIRLANKRGLPLQKPMYFNPANPKASTRAVIYSNPDYAQTFGKQFKETGPLGGRLPSEENAVLMNQIRRYENMLRQFPDHPGLQDKISKYYQMLMKNYSQKGARPYTGIEALQSIQPNKKGGQFPKYQTKGQYSNKLNEDQQFLISMANSPLFEERYNKMTNDLNQIIPSYPSADLFRKNIIDNITSVKYAPEGEGDFTPGKEGGRTSAYYAPRHHTIHTSTSKKDPYAQTHETSHASTLGSLFPAYPYSAKNRNPYKGSGKDLDTYYEPAYDNPNTQRYLSQPTEIKARIDAARKYMMDNNLYDPINQRFTEKDYDNFLFITDQSDIEDLKHNYSKEDVIRMFNEIVANNPKLKATANKGGQFRKYQTEGEYNMERALELGYQPNEEGHWPSVDYETGEYLKSKKHDTAWKEYLYGYIMNPDQALNYNVVVNPEGYFGEDQLQYVPKKAKGGPIVTTEGFKMGPPPQGSFYRIPSDTLYNPTDYRIEAVANTGERKVLEPNTGDTTFKGAKYVDEYMMRKGGQLPKYQTDGEYIPFEDLPKDPVERVKWYKQHGYWDKFAPKKEKPAQELKPENRPQPKAKKLETNQTINRTIKENVTLSPVATYSSARPVGPKQKGEPSRLYEFIQSVEDEGLWNALSQVGNYFEQKTSDVEEGVVPKRSTVVIDKPVKKLKKESSLPQIQILSDTIPDRLDNDKIYVGMSINANKNKFDYRNRLDSKDIKTKAGIAHTYNPFRSFDAYITQKDPDGYPMPIYEKNFEKGRPNSYEDNVIAINKNTGNLSVGIAKNFNNDYVLSRTLPPKIISDIYVGPEGKRNPNLNNKKTITLITPENNKISGQIAFGDTGFEMGGRGYNGGTILISTPDKKHTQFIYGSANDLKDQLNKFKSTYKTNKVLYYDLDQKAFSQAVQSKSGIIKGSKLREMDNTNSSGGHLIYLKENDQNLMKKGGAVKPKISYIRKDGRTVHK